MNLIISIVIVLIVVGLLLYLVDRYLPMDALIKRIIYIVVIIGVIIWLLRIAGLFGGVRLPA